MSRAPYNVLVLPYKVTFDTVQYCIFKRVDMAIWQFIAGGGEDDELPLAAAKREASEEADITSGQFMSLTSMCHVAVNQFSRKAQLAWGESVFVIPVYSFAVQCGNDSKINISDEHLEYMWCEYEEAVGHLRFDLDKTALYELRCRITQDADR